MWERGTTPSLSSHRTYCPFALPGAESVEDPRDKDGQVMICATRLAANGAIFDVSKDLSLGMCVDGSGPESAKLAKLSVVITAEMT